MGSLVVEFFFSLMVYRKKSEIWFRAMWVLGLV